MNADEDLDEQTPADTKPTRHPECRCDRVHLGGCRCEDDGSAAAERSAPVSADNRSNP